MSCTCTVASPPGGEHPAPPLDETEVAPPAVRTEGQQMNGIIEDRASVSSTDMLVSCRRGRTGTEANVRPAALRRRSLARCSQLVTSEKCMKH